ncbi:3-oxo-tetronate kinase [Nonomuraea typhae]|uniref:3-oxo-tetronate kinase n=1 Tax=Nonomuraea typhae TaxID=2603600 RepID=UPI0012F8F5B9|nr:3-oxo-tetronate kinase [Nonomuraea typhae]
MIGAIADDFTGATDVAVALHRHGLRTLLYFGTPPADLALPAHDALVIALKTRTVPKDEAVAQSLAALDWVRSRGACQIYFKYCSTFDSTAEGNIGPVLDALADAVDAPMVAMTPSSPEHGRTQYLGYLFAGDVLLAESPMREHPLTPMTDSYLPRVLDAQSAHRSGVVPLPVVRRGPAAIADRLDALRAEGVRYALVDAVVDDDLAAAGQALNRMRLVAGAAGLAAGLARAHEAAKIHAAVEDEQARNGDPVPATAGHTPPPLPTGRAAVLAGSCSARTLEQVAAMIEAGRPAYRLDALAVQDAEVLAREALAWYDAQWPEYGAPLVYSSLPPDELRDVQRRLGRERSAELLESALGRVAKGLAERDVTRLIAAGGETSGAIVRALGLPGGLIGPEAARGVPWILTPSLSLLLKSGNFGEPDLLLVESQ